MRKLLFVALLATAAHAATYNGKSIDGKYYVCSGTYSMTEYVGQEVRKLIGNRKWNGKCVFKDNVITITNYAARPARTWSTVLSNPEISPFPVHVTEIDPLGQRNNHNDYAQFDISVAAIQFTDPNNFNLETH